LFELECVLDFAASVSNGVLKVTVQAEFTEVGTAVVKALSVLPAIKAIGLDLKVEVQKAFVNPSGKRKITNPDHLFAEQRLFTSPPIALKSLGNYHSSPS
jgi:hypothetical protein